ncbi:HNH endonuclease signature motif containing protein [Acetoanaerobium pronyense]|nr:HNH endonuclease signature motif containing protein [Acetoanaerobium pronyense]
MGCNNIVDLSEKYCKKHKHVEELEKKQRNKFYDNKTRDDKFTKFYKSKAWTKTRQVRLIKDSKLCQDCLSEKKITIADTVHHIIEVKDNWAKRFDIDNLISLCHSCHNKRHKKGERIWKQRK